MAYLEFRKDRGKWRIAWSDATKGHRKLSRRFASCHHGKHMEAYDAAGWTIDERAVFIDGCRNKKQRERLLSAYKELERLKKIEALRSGGYGHGPRYDTPIEQLIEDSKAQFDEKVELRESMGGRTGYAKGSRDIFFHTMAYVADWARISGIRKTGDVSYDQLCGLANYFRRLKNQRNNEPLSPDSINIFIRQTKTWIRSHQDPTGKKPLWRFSEVAVQRALKEIRIPKRIPDQLPAKAIQEILKLCIERDKNATVLQMSRQKAHSKKVEVFEQKASSTDLLPTILMLLVCGCRRQEALDAKWADVDLDNGTIIFRSQKTGAARMLSLTDRQYPISPLFLELLRKWRAERPKDVYVLPPNTRKGSPRPVWPKHPWQQLQKMIVKNGVVAKIQAKSFRSNWVSYMVSMGVPIAVTAIWAGHQPAVLERHYYNYAGQRKQGDTLDEAMGIELILKNKYGI